MLFNFNSLFYINAKSNLYGFLIIHYNYCFKYNAQEKIKRARRLGRARICDEIVSNRVATAAECNETS